MCAVQVLTLAHTQLRRDLDSANKEVQRLEGDNKRLLDEINDHPMEKSDMQRRMEKAIQDKDRALFDAEAMVF